MIRFICCCITDWCLDSPPPLKKPHVIALEWSLLKFSKSTILNNGSLENGTCAEELLNLAVKTLASLQSLSTQK